MNKYQTPKGENPFHKAGMKDKRSTKMSAYDISNTGPKGVLPEEDVVEGEGMSRAAKGYEKYGREGMAALARAGREGRALDPIRDKYNKYDESVAESIDPVEQLRADIRRLAQ